MDPQAAERALEISETLNPRRVIDRTSEGASYERRDRRCHSRDRPHAARDFFDVYTGISGCDRHGGSPFVLAVQVVRMTDVQVRWGVALLGYASCIRPAGRVDPSVPVKQLAASGPSGRGKFKSVFRFLKSFFTAVNFSLELSRHRRPFGHETQPLHVKCWRHRSKTWRVERRDWRGSTSKEVQTRAPRRVRNKPGQLSGRLTVSGKLSRVLGQVEIVQVLVRRCLKE